MAVKNDYSLLPTNVLQTMMNSAQDGLTRTLQSQEYSIANRHQRTAMLGDILQLIADLSVSYQKATGTLLPTAYAEYVNPYMGGQANRLNIGPPIEPQPFG